MSTPSARQSYRLEAVVTAVSATLALLLWVFVALAIWDGRTTAVNQALQHNANLARTFEHHTLRLTDAVRGTLHRVQEFYASGRVTSEDLALLIRESGLEQEILVQLSLVDRGGTFIRSNLRSPMPGESTVDLSDREHIRVHLATTPPPDIFVSRPVLGRVSQRWTIQVSQRLYDTNGVFSAIIVASIDMRYLTDFYRQIDIGRRGSIMLIGLDGVIRVRATGDGSAQFDIEAPESGIVREARQRKSGSLTGHSGIDGANRAASFVRLAELPLVVSVSNSIDDIHERLAGRERALLAIGGVAMCILLLGGWLLARSARDLNQTLVELRQSQHALEAANTAMLSALRSRREFLTAVSHEFRTPLASIRGYAELLQARATEALVRETSATICSNACRLSELLENMLDVATLDVGAGRSALAPVDIRAMIREREAAFAERATRKGLLLLTSADQQVPETVSIDASRVRRILDVLISNAIKFSERGRVSIEVKRFGSGELIIDVSDSGPGVPDALRDRLFQPFQQADEEVARLHGGTGLGLALARMLAEGMGARLELVRTGVGACFRLSLPECGPSRPGSVASATAGGSQ